MFNDSYKLSQYNVLFKRNNNSYLWNTLSGALIKLDSFSLDYIKNFDNIIDDNYFNTLYDNGCIVNKQLDELGKVLFYEKSLMLNPTPSSLYFTIAPGLACNYNCEYCFENGRTSFKSFSDNSLEEIYHFLCKRIIENKNLKRIGISWFGGEPLLYPSLISTFSQKIIAFCNSHNIQYYAGIVTNGRFLTKENVELLLECKVKHVQISIDGLCSHYCKVKGATKLDFDTTIENIVNAADSLPIVVRININDSLSDAIELTDYLLLTRQLDRKIKVYVAHTRQYDNESSSRIGQINHGIFLDNEGRYMRLFGKEGKYSKESFAYREPMRKGVFCQQVCCSNACIGPEGEIYQCEHHFGIKDAIIGNVQTGEFFRNNYSKYFSFKHKPKCKRCSFLPVCLGGCLDDRVNNRDIINCKKYKKRLIDFKMYNFEH